MHTDPNITDRVLEAFAASGLTQAELARRCKVGRASVNGWLKGRATNIRPQHLFMLADALGVEARWLATGEGPRARQLISREQSKLLDAYHHADPAARHAILTLTEQVAEPRDEYDPS